MPNQFINPYTFIPIMEKPDRRDRTKDESTKISGCIECTLTVREDSKHRKGSPLFIPNTSGYIKYIIRNKIHKMQTFYSYDDLSNQLNTEYVNDQCVTAYERNGKNKPENPVISGSEIRGSIRNVYEQLTNSCFLHTNKKNLTHKRTTEAKVPFVMVYNNAKKAWYVQQLKGSEYIKIVALDSENSILKKAKKNLKVTSANYKKIIKLFTCKDNNSIYLKKESDDYKYSLEYKDDYEEWHVHISQPFGNIDDDADAKNRIILYKVDSSIINGDDKFKVSESTLNRFNELLELYKSNSKKSSDKAISWYKKLYKKKSPLLVYVNEDQKDEFEQTGSGNIYLSPSQLSQEVFDNTVEGLLGSDVNFNHSRCTDYENACPACRLFGMIGDNGALKGKLRFCDSYRTSGIEYGDVKILPILGSPSVTSTEFYLEKPNDNAKYWNYDYIAETRKIGKDTKWTRKYITPKLAGRKLYWNSKFHCIGQRSAMNCTITPIVKGSFDFKIYFEDVTEEELKRLLFCLELEENAYNKIGTGKPIGMGQVTIKVNSINKIEYELSGNTINRKTVPLKKGNYKFTPEPESVEAENQEFILKAAKDLSDGTKIDYPRERANGNIYEWFANNRGGVDDPEFDQVLPKIDDDNQVLESHNN